MNDNIDGQESDFTQQNTESILKEMLSLTKAIAGMNEKLENIETALFAGLSERLDTLTEFIRDTNDHLESIQSESKTMFQQVHESVNRTGANLTEAIIDAGKPIEEYRVWLKDELEDATGRMVEASASLETVLCDTMKTLETSLNDVSREGSESVIDTVNKISGNMEMLSIEIDKKISDSERGIVEILTKAFEESDKKATEQIEQITEISGLLVLHKKHLKNSELNELNRRAISYFNSGEYGEAKTLLEKALDISSENPAILANLAHVKAVLGDLESAEETYRKVLEIKPDFNIALSGLGTILIRSDRADETIEFLKELFETDRHKSPDVTLVFAQALTAVGRHGDAVSLLEKAMELAPGHPGIERALQEYGDSI